MSGVRAPFTVRGRSPSTCCAGWAANAVGARDQVGRDHIDLLWADARHRTGWANQSTTGARGRLPGLCARRGKRATRAGLRAQPSHDRGVHLNVATSGLKPPKKTWRTSAACMACAGAVPSVRAVLCNRAAHSACDASVLRIAARLRRDSLRLSARARREDVLRSALAAADVERHPRQTRMGASADQHQPPATRRRYRCRAAASATVRAAKS